MSTNITLQTILDEYREITHTQRDSGTLFEDLMIVYFKNEPKFQTQYQDVLTYSQWVDKYGNELNITLKKDTGIDLVATTFDGKHHAIQCKNYVSSHKMAKSDIDSFMSASGKTYFDYRIIISTVTDWTDNAIDMLHNQQPPVSTINLSELQESAVNWTAFYKQQKIELNPKKQPRPHQVSAIKSVVNGLASADRGKLIMACGTGKTFTSLKIAEQMAGKGKKVLFLVPSLALLSQTLNEWTQQSDVPLRNFAVCSDSDVGKKKQADDDLVIATMSDLDYPATTNAKSLALSLKRLHDDEHMTVVYSTYHSLPVIKDAQSQYDIGEFDLIVCDEAHRTTGATFEGEKESNFVIVHNNAEIQGAKRLYMTATPRVYGEDAKKVEAVELCSMDDEALYGKELFVINFSHAVSLGLLVDYKVVVLAVEEGNINRYLPHLLASGANELNVSDAAKIVGCWKALTKHGLVESQDNYSPMQRAVAFCQVIEKEYRGSKHKVSSKLISEMFSEVVREYQKVEIEELLANNPDATIPPYLELQCECEHVDGSMNASEKQGKIDWLKQKLPENTCHILSNVRCLSEGVDVPSLDAVMFLTPRQSQIDVVQSVGRVMRLAEGKKLGYVILPIVIPAGMPPEEALNNNEVYKVVWQVLNALRSHDDRFDAMINKLDLNGRDTAKMEVIAVTNNVQYKPKSKAAKATVTAKTGRSIGSKISEPVPTQIDLQFEVGEIEKALYAKVVEKCGNRKHWETWAEDIAKIANTHIDRIKALLENPDNIKARTAFDEFATELRDDLNNSISDAEIIEMLAQHLITKPVFNALFEDYDFTASNPMSKAMQKVLEALEEQNLHKETKQLDEFYASVQLRAQGINNAAGKQKIIVDLYDNFFRKAFPRMSERLGIVYTPTEVVDFILHSVENVLNQEFNASLADEGVHILDPFTGTGTFITRLLQSGLIPTDKLAHKYKHEIHANELVLLAYYIACINIEAVYHGLLDGEYTPFEGICLTDTFEMYEKTDLISDILEDNSERRKRQKSLDIRVIIGNPPYSVGQSSENDNNQNVKYPALDGRISETYAKNSTAMLQRNLYDSYIRAIRWASDRIGNQGIIGFITNSNFLEAKNSDGLRKCLADEFSSLYIFNLKGSIRGKSGDNAKKEGQNIFDIMTGVAISILIKNPNSSKTGKVLYFDIGDYLNREEKLEKISTLQSIKGISASDLWEPLELDSFNDWLNHRDTSFDKHIALGNDSQSIFKIYSQGLLTSRDYWCYNFNLNTLTQKLNLFVNFYNTELARLQGLDKEAKLNGISVDKSKINWSRSLKNRFNKEEELKVDESSFVVSMYRPFMKEWCYFNRTLNEMVYQNFKLFPKEQKNIGIVIKNRWSKQGQIAFITNVLFDNQSDGGVQIFPLYLYEPTEPSTGDDLLSSQSNTSQYQRKDAITDEGLAHFTHYYQKEISKEDLFYYIYGLLHSEDYREKYADNLSKQLPRIPRVKTYDDFVAFSTAGRALAELHLNYETVDMYMGAKIECKTGSLSLATAQHWTKSTLEDRDFYVEKMKFAKKDDKSKIVYNNKITISNIPVEAYNYVVNGKSAIEWVMERQSVKTDKDSGIVNDANDWAIETMQNARYPLELLLRVINVSLKTNAIVAGLPKLVTE